MPDHDITAITALPPAEPSGEPAPSPSAADATPGPSSSPDGDSRQSLLDAVQKAVPELRTSSQEGDGDGASPAQAAQSGQTPPDLPDLPSKEERAKFSDSAKARVEKLLNERRDLRTEVERLKGLEPSANAASSVTKYLSDNDIGRDDFLLGLEMMASLRKGDFQRFYAGIQPYMKLAEEYLGISLPPDLQERVRQGHMTTQAAQLFSRERMTRAMAESNTVRQQQRFDQFQSGAQAQIQQVQQQQLANQVRDTVNAWEATVAQSDPDYAAKKAAVQDTMWAVVRERGVPGNPQQAVDIAKEAYKRVNERFRAWTPQRRPTSRVPSSTGRTAGATPEPRSLLEAVQQARQTAPRL